MNKPMKEQEKYKTLVKDLQIKFDTLTSDKRYSFKVDLKNNYVTILYISSIKLKQTGLKIARELINMYFYGKDNYKSAVNKFTDEYSKFLQLEIKKIENKE